MSLHWRSRQLPAPQPCSGLEIPYIVKDDEDHTATPEFVTEDGQSSLTGADLSDKLLSMSGYGKAPEAYVYEYAATRPNPTTAYAALAQPSQSFALQYTAAQTRPTHESSATEVPFAPTTSQFEARDAAYQAQYFPPFIDARSRHLPQITSYAPRKDVHGAKLYVQFRAKYDLSASPATYFSVMFGNKRCSGSLTKLNQQSPYYNYTLTSEIPPFDSTGCLESQVPLMLSMEDEYGNSLGVVEVGDFTFADAHGYQSYGPADTGAKKRRLSSDGSDFLHSPVAKKTSTSQLGPATREVTYYDQGQSQGLPPTPYLLASVPNTYGLSTSYDRSSQHQSQQQPHGAQRRSSYPNLAGISISGHSGKSESPSASNYSPYSSSSRIMRSPVMSMTSGLKGQIMPSPSAMANPPLIRTSTLQNVENATDFRGMSGAAFNPYAMYPNSKAVLKIEGDLDKMAENWTDEEWNAKRRLVHFRRSQSGSTITTSFNAVPPEDRPQHSICISCIWWEEKQDCFVTSVDTIYLLESLVAVRFTVEEKNRIRRNLEGFRPLTVSKAKADSEEFFKVIMGFPNPKPRNIEKDVKVFPWKILSHALKKIISKYSASYSSTAGALLTPVTSGYASAGPSEAGTEHHYSASPRSAASSAPSAAYGSGLTSTSMSPGMRASSAGLEVASAGPHGMRISASQMYSRGGQKSLGQWQTGMHQAQPQYSSSVPGAARGSYDFGAYLSASPSNPASASLPAAMPSQPLDIHRRMDPPQSQSLLLGEGSEGYTQQAPAKN